MTGPYDDLPTWEELCELRTWVMRGCPAGGLQTDADAGRMVRRLWKLIEALPHHLPHYAYGTDEWKAELARLRQEAQDQENAIGDGSEGAS